MLFFFQHINGATRMILETAGVVESAKKEASKSNANKKGKKWPNNDDLLELYFF